MCGWFRRVVIVGVTVQVQTNLSQRLYSARDLGAVSEKEEDTKPVGRETARIRYATCCVPDNWAPPNRVPHCVLPAASW